MTFSVRCFGRDDTETPDDDGEGTRAGNYFQSRRVVTLWQNGSPATVADRETVSRNFFVPPQDDIGLMIYIRTEIS